MFDTKVTHYRENYFVFENFVSLVASACMSDLRWSRRTGITRSLVGIRFAYRYSYPVGHAGI